MGPEITLSFKNTHRGKKTAVSEFWDNSVDVSSPRVRFSAKL